MLGTTCTCIYYLLTTTLSLSQQNNNNNNNIITMKLNEINNQLPNIISTLNEINDADTSSSSSTESIIHPPPTTSPSPSSPTHHHDDDHPIQKECHLILHFDINETILIGDEAGGDTVDDCLNKIIAKSAFVQLIPNHNHDHLQKDSSSNDNNCSHGGNKNRSVIETNKIVPTHWWDGTSIINDVTEIDESSSSSKSSSSPPPPLYTGWVWPPNTCPYYRTSYKKYAKTFTRHHHNGSNISNSNSHGHGYKPYRPLYNYLQTKFTTIHEQIETYNRKTKNNQSNHDNIIPKSHPFYRMIPSFFHLLVKLQQLQQQSQQQQQQQQQQNPNPKHIKYTLVLRTFGTDLNDIALAITDFANGKHPLFPNFYEPNLMMILKEGQNQLYKGRWRRVERERQSNINDNNDGDDNDDDNNSKDTFVFDLYPSDCNESDISSSSSNPTRRINPIASGDEEVLKIIESKTNICGIQDNYHHWDDHNNAPWAGKPVWIHDQNGDNDNESVIHHLFFDDNIHNDANDSIVAVRRKINGKWCSLSGEETLEQQNRHVVRVPTIEAILDDDWFYNKIVSIMRNHL